MEKLASESFALRLAQRLRKPLVARLAMASELSRDLPPWAEPLRLHFSYQRSESVGRYTELVLVAQHHELALAL